MSLATDRLILRELVTTDARRVFEIESQPGVGRYLSGFADSEAAAAAYVQRVIADAACVPRLVFEHAVTLGDRVIGRCGIKRGDAEPRDAMLWYVFDPSVPGHGYATEAARAVLAFAFDELALHRVYADADPRNAASVRVLERLGMRREAHHLENVCIRDEWCDSVIYAMLRREWEAR